MAAEKALVQPATSFCSRDAIKEFASAEKTAASQRLLEEIRKSFKGSLIKSLVATLLLPCELPEVSFLLILGRVGHAPHQAYEAI